MLQSGVERQLHGWHRNKAIKLNNSRIVIFEMLRSNSLRDWSVPQDINTEIADLRDIHFLPVLCKLCNCKEWQTLSNICDVGVSVVTSMSCM